MIARRLRNILLPALGLTGAGLLSAAAPAVSTQPSPPSGHDFTQPVPQARQVADVSPALARRNATRGYGAEGPVLYRTAPVTAPHSFDFVGVEGEMGALEFRARRAGEPWSDWVETADGDPVYTGGADQVQVRSRGTRIEGRLHYVNVSAGNAPASDLLRSKGSSPKPEFISRSEWGADRKNGGCHPRQDPDYGKVKAGVIHHTVSTNDYTEAEAPSIVLGICRYHRNSNGWNDIGYNALVDRFGNLYEGRAGGLGKPVVGAQVEGFNSQTAGIATIADHRSKKPTRGEINGLVDYLSWKLGKSGVDAVGKTRLLSDGGSTNRYPKGQRPRVKEVLGHGDLGFTECPGGEMKERVPAVRRKVQDRIAQGGGSSTPDPPSGGSGPPPRG
jgi:hypothetical protein